MRFLRYCAMKTPQRPRTPCSEVNIFVAPSAATSEKARANAFRQNQAMWFYLLQGIGLGLAAASQPGPFQTYLISQSLSNGWKRTLPAALAPLFSDGPIIALCLLVLSQIPPWMERALYTASGLFVLYLALGAYKSWRRQGPTTAAASETRQSVWKAALMNALSPGPYIFWTLVTGPILVAGWRESPVNAIGFLGGFYLTIVAGLAGIILVFGLAERFGPRVSHAMLAVSALALTLFGMFQIARGIL
jgi:threonine/homoserine/homoserine lactone efflux protein